MPRLQLPIKIKKFIHGQQLFWSLRITLGVGLPTLLLLLITDMRVLPLALGSGAMFVGFLDTPGTQRARCHDMLACTLAVSASVLLTAISLLSEPAMWLVVASISIVGAYAMNFGLKAGQIGLNAIAAMALTLALRNSPMQTSLAYCLGMVLGGVWYLAFSLTISHLLRHQMHRRALSDALFSAAGLFRARACCYDPQEPGQSSHDALLRSQIQLQQDHRLAHSLILGELALCKTTTGIRPELQRLFNLLTDVFDLVDIVATAHTDFQQIRTTPATHALSIQLRDLLLHGADSLQKVAAAIPLNRQRLHAAMSSHRLRELESSLSALMLAIPGHQVLGTLQDSVVRMREMRRLIARLIRDLRMVRVIPQSDLDLALEHYQPAPALFSRPASWWSGPAPRYALRLTLGVLVALGIVQFRGAFHDNWIVLTVVVAMRPGFGLSRQRGFKRVIGTALGCAAAVSILTLTREPHVLILIALTSLMLSFGLAAIDFLASAFFASILLILTYHFLLPDYHIAMLRALDTLIGGGIALVLSYACPYWQSRNIGPLSKALLDDIEHYLANLEKLTPETRRDYRDAQCAAQLRLAMLGNTLESMRLDPECRQLAPAKVHELLLWGSRMIALGHSEAQIRLNQGVASPIGSKPENGEFDVLLDHMRKNNAPDSEQADIGSGILQMRQLNLEIQSLQSY